MIKKLLNIQWWKYGPDILKGLNISTPEQIIEPLEERIYSQKYPEYKAEKLEFHPDGTIYHITSDNIKSKCVFS